MSIAFAGGSMLVMGQVLGAQEPTSGAMPVHYTSQPYKTETQSSTVYTHADGSTFTIELTSVLAKDSQGRFLQGGCTGGINPDGICREYQYDAIDPVAGTEALWRPSTHQAKVFIYPSSIAGRKSCWRVSQEDENVSPGDLPVFNLKLTCPPAEEVGGICWKGRAVKYPNDNPPVPEVSYNDCLKGFSQGSILREKALKEENEDLGVESIQGFEVHGCRKTAYSAAGVEVREQWVTTFGSWLSPGYAVLRVKYQFAGSKGGVTIDGESTTTLDTSEPDLTTFLPPKDYKTKTVEMHEVGCED
jgi:hypothetical protein